MENNNNDDINTLNKILQKETIHSHEQDKNNNNIEVNDRYRRIIGSYTRLYSFEEFIDNLSKNQIRELRDSITDNQRQTYLKYFDNVNTKLDFYKKFDELWNRLTESKLVKEKDLNNKANDKLTLIKTSTKLSLKYCLEWLNINGFLAKKIDNPIFEKLINESYLNLTDVYVKTVQSEINGLKVELNNELAVLCYLGHEFYETLDIENKQDYQRC